MGYFKKKKETEETLDSEGWVHTGDIVELLPSGMLRMIDRKKNLVKLSSGEYIAYEKLENILVEAPFVSMGLVHADDTRSYPVAVISVDQPAVEAWRTAQEISPSVPLDDLLKMPALKREVMKGLKTAADQSSLAGFERVRKIHLTADVWDPSNGLLTPTFKLKRKQLYEKYKSEIAALYEELEAERAQGAKGR